MSRLQNVSDFCIPSPPADLLGGFVNGKHPPHLWRHTPGSNAHTGSLQQYRALGYGR